MKSLLLWEWQAPHPISKNNQSPCPLLRKRDDGSAIARATAKSKNVKGWLTWD
jgi:hypothetical protein